MNSTIFCHGNILWSHCLVRIMHNLNAFHTNIFKIVFIISSVDTLSIFLLREFLGRAIALFVYLFLT